MIGHLHAHNVAVATWFAEAPSDCARTPITLAWLLLVCALMYAIGLTLPDETWLDSAAWVVASIAYFHYTGSAR